jgi:hypothetical protein
LTGFIWYQAVVALPSRSQIVSGDSPVRAGIRLLPMMATAALGTFVAGGASSKRNITAYTTIAGSAFQLLGYGLMTTLGRDIEVSSRIYGFGVLLGLGFGMSVTSTTIMVFLQYLTQPEHTGMSPSRARMYQC